MTRAPRMSVCIPAYDMSGDGAAFLKPGLDSLVSQEFEDFEVIVSDQSPGDGVAALCARYADRLTITHVFFRDGPHQGSANCNNAFRHARGTILKVLFQDDYLCDPTALGQLVAAFDQPGVQWALMGSAVTRDLETLQNPMVPRYTTRTRYGWNTISSPSVLAFEAGHDVWFDENLIWLMDADMFYSCHLAFGDPAILPDTLVANRIHDGQVQRNMDRAVCRREVLYVARKQGLIRAPGDLRAFLWQYLKHVGR
ncbi:MAG: glycosyltransferase family 2 protein [Pseudomonadota bacterium]